ncbi:MAG: DUF4838 domain-containing protein [Armatimonadota bacterium]
MRHVITVLCVLLAATRVSLAQDGIPLADVTRIVVSAEPHRFEELCAQAVQSCLQQRYGAAVEISAEVPAEHALAVFVGREPALSSGLVSVAEIEAAKFDGYVITAEGSRIAVAGYRPRGTLYGGYALLARMGLTLLPDRNGPGSALEVFEALPDGLLPPLRESSVPWFEFRQLRAHFNQGRFGGGSWDDLGDVRTAANPELFSRDAKPPLLRETEWPSSLHTAGYLVPRELYYDEHPEYYALRADGMRIPRETDYHRLVLNLVHPDVQHISAERTLEWMNLQPDRRFFYVQDGDAVMDKSAAAHAVDPMPHYTTDRALRWVNYVARVVRDAHPDNLILTAAYIETVKPPVLVSPEPNVRVMYCPWYWTSRNTSSRPFSHAQNIVAAEELMGWLMRCPGQVGVFDYPYAPSLRLRGQADRIKWYAKAGVRLIDFNGGFLPFEDLCHHVMSWLCWDPLVDSQQLQDEFIDRFYGPAAAPIHEYFALHHLAEWRTHGAIHHDLELIAAARRLFARAEELAGEDPLALVRVQHDIFRWLDTYVTWQQGDLARNAAEQLAPVTAAEIEQLRQDLHWYVRLAARLIDGAHASGEDAHRWLGRSVERTMKSTLQTLAGVTFEEAIADTLWSVEEPPADFAGWPDRLIALVDAGLSVQEYLPAAEESRPRVVTVVSAAEDAAAWSVECSVEGFEVTPQAGPVTAPGGREYRGLSVDLPLSELPVVEIGGHPEGVHAMHAGTFLLRRRFEPALDVSRCHFFDLHVCSTASVPITVYLDTTAGGLRSDSVLHPGEQIVRVDIRQHRRGWRNFAQWDGGLAGIGIDFWPQDNFFPYSPAQDVRITLLGITATNLEPGPGDLPHGREAVWLRHFRPDIPHGVSRYGGGPPLVGYEHLRGQGQALDYGRYTSQAFRTSTERGTLTPIFALVTAPGASEVEREAAERLAEYLQRGYGVRLPVNPPGLMPAPELGNVAVVGRDAALACGAVTPEELEFVGPQGFVIRARDGRIVIAGADEAGTRYGVARLLEEQGMRFVTPHARAVIADEDGDGLLDETVVFDRPWFAQRDLPGGWRLQTTGPDRPVPTEIAPHDPATIDRIAGAIKDAVRRTEAVPPEVLAEAAQTQLGCYLAARLLWDPFLDPLRLVAQFRAAG